MLQKFVSLNLLLTNNNEIISSKLSELNFVITGTLSKSRTFFADLIEAHGGNVSNAISKNTSYLLAGKNSGSKMDKAKKLGVEILNELDFDKMISEGQNGKKTI
jgi:DNA ligase (NAD+)